MKYLGLFLFLISFSVSAQFTKGTIAFGGNVSFSSIKQSINNTDYPASNYLTLSPTVGLFISPTFSLGVFGQINSQKTPTINVITNLFESQKTVSQLYGLFARKYFPLSDKFLVSINGRIGAGGEVKDDNSDDKSSQFLISLSPSLTFLPHEKWGIEAGFGQISYQKNAAQYTFSDADVFSASLGSLSFGINYYINRKD
jgi:hypothetical protein